MQIHRYGYGNRGFGRFAGYGLRLLAMVSDKAQYRYEVLRFWEKYGLAPTLEAFEVKKTQRLQSQRSPASAELSTR